MSAETLSRRRETFIEWMEANGLNVNKVSKLSGVKPTTLYSYVKAETKALTGETEAQIARGADMPVDAIFGPIEPTREPNNVKAWRESLQMSEADLAKAIGTTVSILRMLEDGDITLSAKWLRKLAPALKTSGGFILDHHPDDIEADVLAIYGRVPAENQSQALKVLETFARAAS